MALKNPQMTLYDILLLIEQYIRYTRNVINFLSLKRKKSDQVPFIAVRVSLEKFKCP